MIELKGCPFCGRKAVIQHYGWDSEYTSIRCEGSIPKENAAGNGLVDNDCLSTTCDGTVPTLKEGQSMYRVECRGSYCINRDFERAVKAWNTRAHDEHQQAVIKAAVEAIEDVRYKSSLSKTGAVGKLSIKGKHCRHASCTSVEVCRVCLVDHISPHLEALRGLIDDDC